MHKKRIIVLGGGVSGLAAAWFLTRLGARVSVVEKSSRVGGWIQTVEKEGFLFELGPRACRPQGSGLALLRLIKDLGLRSCVLPSDPSARKRYLYFQGKVRPFPSHPLAFLFSPLTRDLPAAFWRDWRTPPRLEEDDESIYSFFSRRLGETIAERLIDPLTRGVYGGEMRLLSMRSCFPQFYEWEKLYGGLFKGKWQEKKKPLEFADDFAQDLQKTALFSFKEGMETLTRELGHRLKDSIYLERKAIGLSFLEKGVVVHLEGGETLRADGALSTLPASSLASLLETIDLRSASLLRQIPFASLAVVCLGFKENALKKRGFGYLIPDLEKQPFLGMTWDSSTFPQQNRTPEQTRLSVMIGESRLENFSLDSPERLLEIAQQATKKTLDIVAEPTVFHTHLAANALPQYLVGHGEKVKELEERLSCFFPRFSFIGASFYGVAVNACVERAEREAVRLAQAFLPSALLS